MSERVHRVVKKWHRPKLYRYEVGSVSGKRGVWKSPGPKLAWNQYDFRKHADDECPVTGRVRIGLALVLGHWAYAIKWANSEIVVKEVRSRG